MTRRLAPSENHRPVLLAERRGELLRHQRRVLITLLIIAIVAASIRWLWLGTS
jgi:hypothetical protein